MSQMIVLDNEAVTALRDPAHSKHRRVVSHLQIVAGRKHQALQVTAVVPTSIRVEAGWDRTSPVWAFPNRLRITDAPLDWRFANAAAAIHQRTNVSVADAHIGSVVESATADQVVIVTSDPDDMQAVAGTNPVTIVTI